MKSGPAAASAAAATAGGTRGMSAKDRVAARLGTGPNAVSGRGGSGPYGSETAAGRRSAGQWQPPDTRVRNGGASGGGNGANGGHGGGRGGNGGPGRGGRTPRKGDWWRHWSLRKALIAAGCTAAGFAVLLVALFMMAYAQTPIPDASEAALQQASVVYFRDGKTVVGTFGTTDRQELTANQIPAVVKNAVVAIEDKHFYNEGGISPVGIVRAAIADVTAGGVAQGGSTITQEFVRNYYLNIGTAQTASRKIKEILVAQKLASEKSKDWILTQYLNTVLMGGNVYGFGAASQSYFGIPATKLDVGQAAMLAAMIQLPNFYDPNPGTPGYQPLVQRWHQVLNDMVTMGTLSAKDAAAQKFPAVVHTQPGDDWTGYRGYIMQAVENELLNTYHYSQARIDGGGLHIITSISEPMMNELYASVDYNEKLMAEDGEALPSYAHVGAVLQQPSTGQIWAMYSGPSFSQPAAQCKVDDCQFDMALQNREQVGSSFKPYVLALARQQGMNVQTSTLNGDSPLWIPPVAQPDTYATQAKPANISQWYQVANDAGDGSLGGVSVVTASAMSLNSAYTDLYHRVAGNDGQNIVQIAQAFGVNTNDNASGLNSMRDEVGTALGQASLTVAEQANTFATLANNGEYITPHLIMDIEQGAEVTNAKVNRREVLTPDEASDVDYALSFDDKPGGTAPNAALSDGRELVAKTGTTNLAQSAFFIGTIPQFTLAVGMFTNEQGCPTAQTVACAAAVDAGTKPPVAETLYGVGGLQGFGGQWPTSIWRTFAEDEFTKLPNVSFPSPDFGGTAWDLMAPQPKPTPTPTPSQTCNNNGNNNGFGFGRNCQNQGGGGGGNQGGGQNSPTPDPSQNPFVIPTLAATPAPETAASVKSSSSG
jgi:membrane peptidoglycan carboxypeptidase